MIWEAGIGIIEHSAQYSKESADLWRDSGIIYDVIHKGVSYKAREETLRPLTFSEFLFYTDPATGGLKIGKNKAWPLLIGNALALFGAGYAIVELLKAFEPWMLVQLLVCVGVPLVTLLMTHRNFKGKQG